MAFPPHSFMFQTHQDHHHQDRSTSLNSHHHHPTSFHGGHHAPFMMKRSLSFSGVDDHDHDHQQVHDLNNNNNKCDDQILMHGEDELSDDGSQLIGEKKKRLNLEQVKTLEKSFETGNKLEPERKMQLAKALGLQPRQVAIWFQNRRARWKTKQLEKDYEVLKTQFELLKADNDSLQAQNKKLHAELSALKGNNDSSEAGHENLKKEGDQGSWSNGSCENSSDVNLDISRPPVVINTSSANSTQIVHGKTLFPSILRPNSSITQLLQGPPRSDLQSLNKVDPSSHHHQMVQSDGHDQSFCNMFVNGATGVEEHQGFWPWPEQQHNYFH